VIAEPREPLVLLCTDLQNLSLTTDLRQVLQGITLHTIVDGQLIVVNIMEGDQTHSDSGQVWSGL
jgi:hypothetical protein